jgi:hypothetical protein
VLDSSSWRWCCWALGVGTGEALGVLEGHADTLQDMEPSSELSARCRKWRALPLVSSSWSWWPRALLGVGAGESFGVLEGHAATSQDMELSPAERRVLGVTSPGAGVQPLLLLATCFGMQPLELLVPLSPWCWRW